MRTRASQKHLRLLVGLLSNLFLFWLTAQVPKHRHVTLADWVPPYAFLLTAGIAALAIASLIPVMRGVPKGEFSWLDPFALFLLILPIVVLGSLVWYLFLES